MYRYTARAGSKRSIPALIIRLYRAASLLTGWDLCPVITIIMLSGKERERERERETFPLFLLSADSFRYITLWQESIAFQYSSLSSIFVMITSHHHWWSFGAPNLKLDIASEACVKWSRVHPGITMEPLYLYDAGTHRSSCVRWVFAKWKDILPSFLIIHLFRWGWMASIVRFLQEFGFRNAFFHFRIVSSRMRRISIALAVDGNPRSRIRTCWEISIYLLDSSELREYPCESSYCRVWCDAVGLDRPSAWCYHHSIRSEEAFSKWDINFRAQGEVALGILPGV